MTVETSPSVEGRGGVVATMPGVESGVARSADAASVPPSLTTSIRKSRGVPS
jgi:hypothetical protein